MEIIDNKYIEIMENCMYMESLSKLACYGPVILNIFFLEIVGFI